MTERINHQELPKGFLDGLMKSTLYLKNSSLDPKLLELLNYRVSQINGCAYCLDMHFQDAMKLGETPLRLHSVIVWSECPFYTEKEKAALAFAEALTNANQQDVDDKIFNTLSSFFTKDEIAHLTLAVIQINSWNRLNKTFKPIPGNYKPGMHG
jgi:AhpD family alkylhydroperoxidase